MPILVPKFSNLLITPLGIDMMGLAKLKTKLYKEIEKTIGKSPKKSSQQN